MLLTKTSTALHLVRRPQSGKSESSSESYWVPNTDVYAVNGGLVIRVELAGLRREDLELMLEGNRLTISGQRNDDGRAPKCTFYVMEIDYGPFESVIELPPGYDLCQAKAAYQNGFLQIDVPELGSAAQKPASGPISAGE